MKHITNLLLLLMLVCYVFLPFYNIAIQGSITGFDFTAGSISQIFSFRHVVMALMPFIACFFAIGFNCLKGRWWGLVSILFILVGFVFFVHTFNFRDAALLHAPEEGPVNDLGEGFAVEGLGIGYNLSFIMLCLSLVAAVMALLPLKINRTIDKAFDDSFNNLKAFQHRMNDEIKEWQVKYDKSKKKPAEQPQQPEQQTEPEEPESQADDHSRFMPPGDL